MIKPYLLIISAILFLPHLVFAVCSTPPSCDSLGYTTNISDCDTDMPVLKCISDTSKAVCTKKGSCRIGSILFSDKSCANTPITGKTAIAVVFDAQKKLAVALDDSSAVWSSTRFDIPQLSHWSTSPEAVRKDFEGKANTQIIDNFCKTNSKSCPAAQNSYQYATTGTTAGDWFLPAAGQLSALNTNKKAVNTSLQRLGKTTLGAGSSPFYWSSSIRSSNTSGDVIGAVIINFSTDRAYTRTTVESFSYRPVLAY